MSLLTTMSKKIKQTIINIHDFCGEKKDQIKYSWRFGRLSDIFEFCKTWCFIVVFFTILYVIIYIMGLGFGRFTGWY